MGVVKGDRSIIRKNSTGNEFINRRVNFIEGSNITLTVASDPTDNEVDVTIASTGGSGSALEGTASKLAYFGTGSLLSGATGLHWDSANQRLGIGVATPGYQLHIGNNGSSIPVVFGSAPTVMGALAWMPNNGNPYFGIVDSGNGNVYGISSFLPAPQSPLPSSTIGGYYAGLGIGAKTNQGNGQPIFGVLAANQSLNGPGNTAFTVYDTNRIADYHSNYNNGSGQMGLGIIATNVINERLMVNGRIGIGYTTGASGASGFGKIYMKPSDNLLYFQTPVGVEYNLTATGGGSGSVGGSGVANKLAFWGNASMLSGASTVDYQPSTGVLTASKLVRGFASTPSSSATWAIDFNTGSIQYTMLSAATVTVWMQNPVNGGEYTLITRQDETGSRFINWPANVVWAGGTTPTPTSSSTYVDIYKLIYNSTASVYWAVPTLNFAR